MRISNGLQQQQKKKRKKRKGKRERGLLRTSTGWRDEGTAACPKAAQFELVYTAFCK